ncbi:glycosyltransferase [Gilvibacter sediminis]|uniref:glycosyltransferase n=1 Tax=Gilvibacter sediminis TaxID=379071 RepID=UPI002350BB9F|nr:glycosyltransferase [Gilvibacter sediminis]MDC7999131.1 glycosyltransferase [Gilvibacter sediminis]
MVIVVTPQIRSVSVQDGPNKSLVGICSLLESHEIPYKVLALTDPLGAQQSNTAINPKVDYMDGVSAADLKKRFEGGTVIWLNTLYNWNFTVKPLLALRKRPDLKVIVSPRGQLLKGALNLKKRLYLKLLTLYLKSLKNKVWIHYANTQEKAASLALFEGYPELIFNNPISGTIQAAQRPAGREEFVLGYFGRVSPIKNIEFVIKQLPKLPKEVRLEIHGTIVDPIYQQKLMALIEKLQLKARVGFHDTYNNFNFAKKSAGVDLVIIPSRSESFCHVFFEAIEAGKLVLASTGLPWEKVNASVPKTLLPLKGKQWRQRITEVLEMTDAGYDQQHKELVNYYNNIYTESNTNIVRAVKTVLDHETQE